MPSRSILSVFPDLSPAPSVRCPHDATCCVMRPFMGYDFPCASHAYRDLSSWLAARCIPMASGLCTPSFPLAVLASRFPLASPSVVTLQSFPCRIQRPLSAPPFSVQPLASRKRHPLCSCLAQRGLSLSCSVASVRRASSRSACCS
jgi:hypothetical protein